MMLAVGAAFIKPCVSRHLPISYMETLLSLSLPWRQLGNLTGESGNMEPAHT